MRTLIVVDVQNDFLPGGSLAVKEGEVIVPIVNRLRSEYDQVIFTQDWHPPTHKSFAANHPGRKPGEVVDLDGLPQVLWPVHCVQGTAGAKFHKDLIVKPGEAVFRKGTDPSIDSYSAFYDNAHRKSTGMADYLRHQGIKEVALCGLATDYCVKFTALDAITDGFECVLIADACRAVELKPGDGDAAIDAMRGAGVAICDSGDLGV